MTITDTQARTPPALDLSRHSLFLDLDGTLAPIVARPSDVGPDPRRTAILEALVRRMDGRVAILSGRTLAEVDHIAGAAVGPVAAVHGLDRRRPDGALDPVPPHPALPEALSAFRALAGRDPGLIVEEKGLSAALHYRQAPAEADAVQALAQDLAQRTGLKLQPGHMVVELRTPGPDKGDSLRDFMAVPPFSGSTPVFVGDDLTDEPAFRAACDGGGFGVLVGPARNSAATHRLEDVSAVLDWLESAL
ncbi:MAG: trehalose-phosphatase [Phenylobacterium sp. RIFCSPHIGHO2_01_FULL_70_10]|nr:MAG: trehalose-phosphatase [Phenylobacterium sp. RIFCSPHIGHO2_01_FULL_70_10]